MQKALRNKQELPLLRRKAILIAFCRLEKKFLFDKKEHHVEGAPHRPMKSMRCSFFIF